MLIKTNNMSQQEQSEAATYAKDLESDECQQREMYECNLWSLKRVWN